MKKIFNLSYIPALIIAGYFAYSLLLCQNNWHTSISEIIDYADHLEFTKHIIVLGVLPVYIAVVLFGSAMMGLYLSSLLNHLSLKFGKSKQPFI